MITVTGEKGLTSNPGASPEKLAGSIAGGFKSACPDSFAAKPLGAPLLNFLVDPMGWQVVRGKLSL